MSEAITDRLESEAYEAIGEADYEGEAGFAGEAGFVGEAGSEAFGEASRSDARARRERQRQLLLARQRQAELRMRPSPPRVPAAGPPTSQTVAAIRSDIRDLNLDTKLDLDTLRRRLDAASQRGDRAMYSALLSILGSQALATFDPSLGRHQVVSAAIRWAPSLLLTPTRMRPWPEGLLLSPTVITAAAMGAILISGHFITAPQGVHNIIVTVPSLVGVGGSGRFIGTPVDRNGNVLSGVAVEWSSRDPQILNVQPDGSYTAMNPGPTQVAAKAPPLTVWTPVTVQAVTRPVGVG